jgi:hypothetical protein
VDFTKGVKMCPNSSGWGYGPVVSCHHGNETFDSIKGGEFLGLAEQQWRILRSG